MTVLACLGGVCIGFVLGVAIVGWLIRLGRVQRVFRNGRWVIEDRSVR